MFIPKLIDSLVTYTKLAKSIMRGSEVKVVLSMPIDWRSKGDSMTSTTNVRGQNGGWRRLCECGCEAPF